jgi:prolycopene isomerase
MGGLTTAAKLVEKGARVVVLEKYLVPGGSAAHYKREGYTFDVGSSMMFGFGDQGTTNLITKALEAVGKKMQTLPDPTQVHYHLPASKAHPQVRGFKWGCVVARQSCPAGWQARSDSSPHAPCACAVCRV